MAGDAQNIRDIPGALDPGGPNLAWDEMERKNHQKAALFFEAWIGEYIGSDYMKDPAFKEVIGAAVLDYGICLTHFSLDSNLSKCIGMFFMASSLRPSISGDCLQNISFVLDRVLELKTTKVIPLDLEKFQSGWAQSLLDAWFRFQREDYQEALKLYEDTRLALGDCPQVLTGIILSNYAIYKNTDDSAYLQKAIAELRDFNDSQEFSFQYVYAPVCATETVKSKAADLAMLKWGIKRYRLMDLNTVVRPKADAMMKLKGLGKVEVEFPKEIETIQFISMIVIRGSKHGGEDLIELVGTVFPSDNPQEGEMHIGKIYVKVYGDPDNPRYETSWCLIDWQEDDNFIMTTSRGDKLKNGATPIE